MLLPTHTIDSGRRGQQVLRVRLPLLLMDLMPLLVEGSPDVLNDTIPASELQVIVVCR